MKKNIDEFNKVHELINDGLHDEALNLLYNKSLQHLNEDYLSDENHAWYLIGNIYYKKKKYKKSVVAFKKSILSRSDDVEAMWALGNCYMDLELPEKAETILCDALKISDKQEIIYNYANSLFDQEKYNEAVKIYNKISKENNEIYELAQKNINHIKNKKGVGDK